MGLIGTSILFQKLWGIWPSEGIQQPIQRKLYGFYRFLVLSLYTIFNVLQTIQCMRLIILGGNLERISKSISVALTLVLMLWKGFIYQKNHIPEMCREVEEHEESIKTMEHPEIRRLYHSNVKSMRMLNIYVVGASLFTLFAFIIISVIDLYKTGPVFWECDDKVFMHELYLPFEKKNYRFAIIFTNVVVAIESVIVNAMIQSTLYGLIIYACTRLKILAKSIENIDEVSKDARDAEKRFIGFIIEHQTIIKFVNDLNEGIKNVLLMSFALNSIKVASILIQILSVENVSDLMFPMFYFLMQISEVFLMGWLCNEVKEQSLMIADAAYQILWYSQSKKLKRMVQILIMRSQKYLTMKIGPFAPMTTDTIVTTIKAAYSYAMLMLNQK